MMSSPAEWTSIGLLGGLHGVNPAMGWLFAVSLGLQAQSSRAVWSALGPLALVMRSRSRRRWPGRGAGRGIAGVQRQVDRRGGAPGLRRVALPRACASRWGGWHVRGAGRLTMWSFLVSSAHGAGLMVLPFVLPAVSATASGGAHVHSGTGHAAHLAGVAMSADQTTALLATLLHTLSYVAVSGTIAYVVYQYFGLRFLRRHGST